MIGNRIIIGVIRLNIKRCNPCKITPSRIKHNQFWNGCTYRPSSLCKNTSVGIKLNRTFIGGET